MQACPARVQKLTRPRAGTGNERKHRHTRAPAALHVELVHLLGDVLVEAGGGAAHILLEGRHLRRAGREGGQRARERVAAAGAKHARPLPRTAPPRPSSLPLALASSTPQATGRSGPVLSPAGSHTPFPRRRAHSQWEAGRRSRRAPSQGAAALPPVCGGVGWGGGGQHKLEQARAQGVGQQGRNPEGGGRPCARSHPTTGKR